MPAPWPEVRRARPHSRSKRATQQIRPPHERELVRICGLGAVQAVFDRDPGGIPGDSLGRQLPALFHLAELRQAPRAQALIRDAWLPGIQVMAARIEGNQYPCTTVFCGKSLFRRLASFCACAVSPARR